MFKVHQVLIKQRAWLVLVNVGRDGRVKLSLHVKNNPSILEHFLEALSLLYVEHAVAGHVLLFGLMVVWAHLFFGEKRCVFMHETRVRACLLLFFSSWQLLEHRGFTEDHLDNLGPLAQLRIVPS